MRNQQKSINLQFFWFYFQDMAKVKSLWDSWDMKQKKGKKFNPDGLSCTVDPFVW